MPSRHLNIEALWKGRSHKCGEHASDPRESGSTSKARRTIREYRERSSEESDRNEDPTLPLEKD